MIISTSEYIYCIYKIITILLLYRKKIANDIYYKTGISYSHRNLVLFFYFLPMKFFIWYIKLRSFSTILAQNEIKNCRYSLLAIAVELAKKYSGLALQCFSMLCSLV